MSNKKIPWIFKITLVLAVSFMMLNMIDVGSVFGFNKFLFLPLLLISFLLAKVLKNRKSSFLSSTIPKIIIISAVILALASMSLLVWGAIDRDKYVTDRNGYKCIGSINCMPMSGKENSIYCNDQDYINWAFSNCPDYRPAY